jgi:hypothetical protein
MGDAKAPKNLRDGLCRNRLIPITWREARQNPVALHVSENLTGENFRRNIAKFECFTGVTRPTWKLHC